MQSFSTPVTAQEIQLVRDILARMEAQAFSDVDLNPSWCNDRW